MDVLDDTSAATLRRAVRDNLLQLLRAFGRAPSCRLDVGDGWCWWRAPVPHPWFNGVASQALPAGGVARLLGTAAPELARSGAKAFRWWLTEDDPPAAFRAEMEAAGLVYSGDTPGMAARLDALRWPPAVGGLEVRLVRGDADLERWTRLFCRAYGFDDAFVAPLVSIVAALGSDLPFGYYLGSQDGRPVATSALHLAAGVAGVYFVASLPEARRRGVGAQMTAVPLAEARRRGFRVGALQTSQTGQGLGRRLGFAATGPVDHYAGRLSSR